jgi:ubiquinone/menaquinone biosynthesis C-methylase UbiE
MQSVKAIDNSIPVNEAFSKQSLHYDVDDLQNPLLQEMRLQVYDHVSKFVTQPSRILELNSGTGIDALYFSQQGHTVHATDLSDGMIEQIKTKINYFHLTHRLTCQKLSYAHLDQLKGQKFDFVFSNFGGLNCIPNLIDVTKNLPSILNPGGFVTWVIMPPVCLWEILSILKGNRNAFRRFNKNGITAHLEGKYFKIWYHSLRSLKKSFGDNFKLIHHEGLAALSPPPHAYQFPVKHPLVYDALRKMDSSFRDTFPFNRWADHLVITFQYLPKGNDLS